MIAIVAGVELDYNSALFRTEIMKRDGEVRVVYEFGGFRADPLSGRLICGGEQLALTPKAFEALLVLIANRGETVSKSELMDAIWADTAVEENNLTQQIATLRRALGERSGEHRFIVTQPGKGYRFVAPVNEIELAHDEELIVVQGTRSTVSIDVSCSGWLGVRPFWRSSTLGYSIAILYVAIICMISFWPVFAGYSTNHRQTVAVLSFRAFAVEDEALGTGIRDTLRARLGNLEDVAVLPSRPDLPADDALFAGRVLNADVIITGSVQREDERMRVAVEMVHVRSQRVVWGQTFDCGRSEFFQMQDAIAGEAVRAIRSSVL